MNSQKTLKNDSSTRSGSSGQSKVWVRGQIDKETHRAVRVEMVQSGARWDQVSEEAYRLWLSRQQH